MHTRSSHYRKILGPWWLTVNGLWTLLSSSDTLVSHYGSPDFKKYWDALWIVPKVSWEGWLAGVAGITAVFTLESSYKLVKGYDDQLEHFRSLPPAFDVKVLALYVQPRFNPEYSQVSKWIAEHEIPLAEADNIGRLIEDGTAPAFQSYSAQKLLRDLSVRCDVFLHVRLISDHPETIRVIDYELQALQHGGNTHVARWIGGLGDWRMTTLVASDPDGTRTIKTHRIIELPAEFRQRGIPVEGWLHFFIYDIPYSDIGTRTYRLNVIGGRWNAHADIQGSENGFSRLSSLREFKQPSQ